MSERQARGSLGRMASPGLRTLRRLRVMSTGRWHAPLDARRAPTVIAVGAAEAGAGKSIVACNLAASIAGLGTFARPASITLFGVPPPQAGQATQRRAGSLAGTQARAARRARPDDARAQRPPPALRRRARADAGPLPRRFVGRSCASFTIWTATSWWSTWGRRTGPTCSTSSACNAFRLLVTSRKPRALETTYAFLKSAAARAERRHRGDARAVLARFSGGLVGNATDDPEQEETFHAFSRLVREHLGIALPVVGCLTSSERIAQSIVARQPLTVRRGIDDNVRQFHHMAETIMNDDDAPTRECPLDGDFIDSRSRRSRRGRRLRAQARALPGRLGRGRWSSRRATRPCACATCR